MTGIESDAIGRELLRALPRGSDGLWHPKDVSTALRSLHASLKDQLLTQEAQYEAVSEELRRDLQDGAYLEESIAVMETLDAMRRDADALQQDVDHTEMHFRDVSTLLEPAMERLQQLTARATYLETAMEIERRSADAKTHAEAATMEALSSFQSFASFVQTIPESFSVLRSEARRRMTALSQGIKRFAVVKLQQALERVEWPRTWTPAELDEHNDAMRDVTRAFGYLVTLQVSQGSHGDDSASLWAMDCVLEPVRLRFRYHFERDDSKTNRLTKPEWYLTYIVEQTQAHSAFLYQVLGPALRDAMADASATSNNNTVACADPVVLFLRGLVRTAAHKLSHDLPALLTERAVLCHTIDEVLLFERVIDESFGYAAFADVASQRQRFPRLVDALTADVDVLFAWTTSDLQFARETLHSVLLLDDDATRSTPWDVESTTQLPAIATQFTALLDLLCQRFAVMADDGHRYLYVTQVLVELLQSFQRVLAGRQRALSTAYAASLADRLALVNTAQHIVDVLTSWDQNALFLELLKRVATSERSRSQVVRMHLAYSKRVLKTAAKAATETILAREEAVAVRQAIAGPGSVIGPAAAFTAAYSVGSKTMKSLFGQSREELPAPPSEDSAGEVDASPERKEEDDNNDGGAGDDDTPKPPAALEEETLLLARSLFERPIAEFKGIVASLLAEIQREVERAVESALAAYRTSPQWRQTESLADAIVSRDVSSELAAAWSLLRDILLIAKRMLASETLSQLWKPLATTIDDAVAAAVLALGQRWHGHRRSSSSTRPSASSTSTSSFSLAGAATAIGALPASPRDRASIGAWTADAKQQFLFDMHALLQIVQLCASNPRAYLRKTADLCRLAEMPAARLAELELALDGVEDDDASIGSMEQITTMLEASGMLSLRAQEVRVIVRLMTMTT
ncbi:hypothetical protein PINS_up009924 [Pythium insidiosum]|nr:hypothetical protein PINS_up009924 [Pythium insidiosum]